MPEDSSQHVLRRLAKWSLDEESVEASDHGWSSMFWKQLSVPVFIMLAGSIIAMQYDGPVPGYYIAATVAMMALGSLPALGAYYYSREADADA